MFRVIFLFPLLFLSVNLFAFQFAISKVTQRHFCDTIDIQFENGLMVGLVSIGESKEKFRFLIDTGAPTSISKSLYDSLKLDVVHKGKIRASNNLTKQVEFTEIPSFTFGRS